MKKLLFILFISLVFGACTTNVKESDPSKKFSEDMTPQEFVDYKIRKSPVVIEGHEYILFEYGARASSYGNYHFQLEHSMECKECLAIFD